MRRLRIVVTGRVQGVGFRWAAREKALALGLVGSARNLSEGCVEMVVEGEERALRAFRAWCYSGPRGAMVQSVHVQEEPVAEALTSFSILPSP